MDTTLHDLRNNLAVAIGTVHAFIDGKLNPDAPALASVLAALQAVEAALPAVRRPAPGMSSNERMLDAVIEGSPYAKVLVDRAGRIALVNVQTEKLFGYSRDELLGQPIEMLVPERLRGDHGSLRDVFYAAPKARPMGNGRELFGRRSDGSDVAIEIGLNPIETESGSYTLAAITDITERKHAETLRLAHLGVERHAAELEVLNRELATASRFKTQFVATMSHELRTPLTAIVGAAELLTRSKLDERTAISVQTIFEAAETLLSLINTVLDFSKIEAGKVELVSAPFSVEPVVEGTAEVVAQLARDKGVTLYTYVDPAIPTVQGDADRLRQILLNLLGNAVKFTDRGRVVVRAFLREQTASDALLRFEVEDTGGGIPADVVPLLFEPFTQAHANAAHVTGTGLGLSIARSLAELMGGTISVESTLGEGSLFWFTARFPLSAENRPAAYRHILDGVAGLVISGDDTFAEIVERYMESWSMECRRIRSRETVVEAMQDSTRTWIAIVDLENVGVSDIGVTVDILRAVVPARVIAIGKDAPLRKPIRQSHLHDAIVKAIGAERPVPVSTVSLPPVGPVSAPSGPILVAEDNPQLQRLLKLQFDDLGVPVVFVSDGAQAVDAVGKTAFALVFMDCQMPIMDGLTATRTIRENEHTRGGHVPIAAMTANAFSEDRDACIAAGMDDYLAKPVKLADLRVMIERWSPQRTAGG